VAARTIREDVDVGPPAMSCAGGGVGRKASCDDRIGRDGTFGSEDVPRRAWRRIAFAVGVWALLLVGWVVYQHRSGLGPSAAAQRLVDIARGNWRAILAYVLVSVVRPLVLFPATLVTIAAGMLFGPVVGVAVAVVAANTSAMVGYSVGRFVRADVVSCRSTAQGTRGLLRLTATR
jgi:hypothetical protein